MKQIEKKRMISNKSIKTIAAIFLLLLPLIGFSQQKITDIVIPEGKAVICVARGGEFLNHFGKNPVLLNQSVVFALPAKTFAYLIVSPGEYTISGTEALSKKEFFATESFVHPLSVKANEFLCIKVSYKLTKAETLAPVLTLCNGEEFAKLNKSCKLLESNPKNEFHAEDYPIGTVISQSDYEAHLSGTRAKNLQMMNNLTDAFKPVSAETMEGSVKNKKNAGVYFTTGTTVGSVVEKDSNGLYRPVPKITCNQCKGSGFNDFNGMTIKCTRCHGKGYIEHD